MEDRLRTTLTRALGRAVTDDEYFQVKDRIQHHYRLLADDQPPLSETERMMEAGRRTAREMTAKAKATLAQLQQRAHEVDNSPNPLRWTPAQKTALIASAIFVPRFS
jgi:hypothetical protein